MQGYLVYGHEAQIGNALGKLQVCKSDPKSAPWEHAKLNGADYRAVGNEPPWNLEIHGGNRLLLVSGYGAPVIEYDLDEPVVDTVNRTTRWESDGLILEVIGTSCSDTMSGALFGSKAVVTWNGQTLWGCGRALH